MKKLPEHIPQLVDKAYAARLCGMTPQNFNVYCKRNNPSFFAKNPTTGKMQVSTRHEEYVHLYNECQITPRRKPGTVDQHGAKRKGEVTGSKAIRKAMSGSADSEPDGLDIAALTESAIAAEIAARDTIIAKAKIAQEKAKQEELKTYDLQKNTAPIELMVYFFSFAEGMISRIHRRPHEIEPELESLFLAGNKKEATKKLIRELEAIITDEQSKLIEAMRAEGYELRRQKDGKR